jgi:hypothetical protein
MAGLYEGLEEVGFAPADAGGYVFQTNNRWLVGPKRRYLVTEAQKIEIAACIRDSLKAIKRIALIAAVVMPVTLIAGIFWLVSQRGTLTVTETRAGENSSYIQSIGLTGSTGTLRSGDLHLEFRVSGPPGDGATVTVTGFDKDGKPGTPAVVAFGSKGVNANLADAAGHVVASAHLSGQAGPSKWIIQSEAAALALVMFLGYTAAIHIYSMRRLEPLLAGLPRTDARITMRQGMQRLVAKMSVKLLVVMIGSMTLGLAGALFNLTMAVLNHDLINAGIFLFVATLLGFATVAYACLAFLRFRGSPPAAAV